MRHPTETPRELARFDRDLSPRRVSSRTGFGALALTLGVLAASWMLNTRAPRAPTAVPAPVLASTTPVEPAPYEALLDAGYALGAAPGSFAGSGPLTASLVAPPDAPLAVVAQAEIVPPAPAPPALVAEVPLPTPRPPELQAREGRGPVRGRQVERQTREAAAAPAPDNRSFLEKFFGMGQPSGPALAYATPEDDVFGRTPTLTGGPSHGYDRWTAVYDIAAHTVYMPDGSRLEAHSGLGDRLDDPRHVNERNRGATPPQLYDLQPREQLFHGVQALRLNPVGGGGVFGRDGLLAHTYMLGPNGDSNGCVSFRNYDAFLQAFSSGTVKRLAVVARLS